MVPGAPRHSQSQGWVEKGNYSVELMIAAKREDKRCNSWKNWLPQSQCRSLEHFFYIFGVLWFLKHLSFSTMTLPNLGREGETVLAVSTIMHVYFTV